MGRKRRRSPHPPEPRERWGSVYPLLDLHGMTADEALRRAEAWLRARRSEGARTVVVVTGRGNRSRGFPVLRSEVEHLLHLLRGTLVARFTLVEGGGAFRVELHRAPRPSMRSASAMIRRADAALVRRAEEALWELGVTPTPVLLEAEIRRIQEGGGGEV